MIVKNSRAGMTWPEMMVLCLIIIVVGLIVSSSLIRSFDVELLENDQKEKNFAIIFSSKLEIVDSLEIAPVSPVMHTNQVSEAPLVIPPEPVVVEPIKKAEVANSAKKTEGIPPDEKVDDAKACPVIDNAVIIKKINKKDEERKSYSAIHIAVVAGLPGVVRMIAPKGQDINKPSKSGVTPLGLACKHGNLEIVKILINAGADVDGGSKAGHAPILVAVQNSFHLIVAQLLKAGSDIKILDSEGLSLLHIAAENGCEPILKLLVEKGMPVNSPVSDNHKYYAGKTALDFALGAGNMDAIGYLVTQGAKNSP